MASLLRENPLDNPDYEYGTILPFRMRNTLDVDELDTDVTPELAVPDLLPSDNDNRPGGTNLLGLYTGGVI